MKEIIPYKFFKGVYALERDYDSVLLTKNLTPGKTVYDEELLLGKNEKGEKVEYRTWNHSKSKLGAALAKDINQIGIKEGDYVLYLGASTGTTVSHVSDIVGANGLIFALDFAPRVLRNMVLVAESRPNIAPILADANMPESYASHICEVDIVFMDIAQKNQVEIFLKNCKLYLKQGGFGLLALKARSVDVTRNPKDIFLNVKKILDTEMTLVDYRELAPFEKDHAFYVVKKK